MFDRRRIAFALACTLAVNGPDGSERAGRRGKIKSRQEKKLRWLGKKFSGHLFYEQA